MNEAIGHTGLIKTLYLLRKLPSGMCDCEMEEESEKHVICHCIKYETQRIRLKDELKKYGVSVLNLKNILNEEKIIKIVFIFLIEAGLI